MATALLDPKVGVIELSPAREAVRTQAAAVRRSEWVVLAFLAYASLLGSIMPVAPEVRDRIVLVNLSLGILYGVLIRRDSARPRLALSVIRDWLPLATVILAYREMGWFALAHPAHAFESRMVVWDRLLLRDGGRQAIEVLGPLFPSLLELAYAGVYLLPPFAVATLYLLKRRDLVDQFLFVFAVGVLLCYAQFPFWPSEPPRVVFAGVDLPTYDTALRHFNLWMLGNCGIHTSVFPSAHVGGSVAAAFGLARLRLRKRWPARVVALAAVLIAIATVYGRYHYAADAAAGLAMGFLASLAAGAVIRRD